MRPRASKTMRLTWPALLNIELSVLLPLGPKGLAMVCRNILLVVWILNARTIHTSCRSPWVTGWGKHCRLQWRDSWFIIPESNMLSLTGPTMKIFQFIANARADWWLEITPALPRQSLCWLERKLSCQGSNLGYELRVTDVLSLRGDRRLI
jgi:hypothetical protein